MVTISQDCFWRGLGGRPPTVDSVEFDKQLDKISLWMESWDHQQRCKILEGLLTRSNYTQFQFLWTVMQPALHRDFMYTAKKEFPELEFSPLSTYTSRTLQAKLIRNRQANYHRIKSAHWQHTKEVRQGSVEPNLPKIVTNEFTKIDINAESRSSSPKKSSPTLPKIYSPSISRQKLQRDISGSPSKIRSGTQNCKRSASETSAAFMGDPPLSSWDVIHSAPPSLRFIEMPVRRHMQEEEGPKNGTFTHPKSRSESQRKRNRTKSHSATETHLRKKKVDRDEMKRSQSENGLAADYPEESWALFQWYSDYWNDVQRNEFLHKILLKLDPRQHYFISTYLSVKQYRDFISLLPEDLALKILSYLGPADVVTTSRVSKTWRERSNNNELWKAKCMEVELEIPVPSKHPEWKKVFKDNMYLKLNWTAGKCRVTDVKGHTHRVLSVTFDQDRMASGSLDRTIRVWDIKSGALLQTLKGHTKGVWCLRFFTKNLLISGGHDGAIKVWNLNKGSCARTLLAHEGPVWAMVRRENTVVSVSQDRTAKVWDISRCLLQNTLQGHNAAVFAVDMNEEGSVVITGSADRSVRIWNPWTGKCNKVIWASQSTSIMSVSYSKGFVACSYGETILLYRVDGAKLVKTYEEHEKRIECLQLRIVKPEEGEGMIISAGKDGMLKYWDVKCDDSIQTFKGHHGQVNCISFDETRIASASYDNKIKIWDFNF